MPRRDNHANHDQENHDRWLISYSDFITLLFAFFVVMYSISSVNEGKYKVLSQTLIGAFDAPEILASSSKDPIELAEFSKNSMIDFEGQSNREGEIFEDTNSDGENVGSLLSAVGEQVEQAFEELVQDEQVSVDGDESWVEISLNSNLLFTSGSARLNTQAIPLLQEIAGILSGYENPIHVEGFTDNVPIQSNLYPSNWELSAARSASVVRLLMESGVDPNRLAAIGYGEFQPFSSNETLEGRSENRRVVLVMSRDLNVRRSVTGAREADDDESNQKGFNPFLREKDDVKSIELEGGGLLFTQDN